MKKIEIAVFKTKCLAIFDEVQAKHEAVIITKHGKPMAKVIPLNSEASEIYNFMAGKGSIVGDVLTPALSSKDWGECQ